MSDSNDRDSSTWRRKQAAPPPTARTARSRKPMPFEGTPAPSGNWRRSSSRTTVQQRAESKEASEDTSQTEEAANESAAVEWDQENRPLSSPPVLEPRPLDRTEPAGIDPVSELARPLPVKSAVAVLRRVDSSSPSSLAVIAQSQSAHGQLQSEHRQQQQQWQTEFVQEQQTQPRPTASAPVASPPSVASGPARAIHVDEVVLQQAGFESATLLLCPLHPLLTAQAIGAMFSPYGALRVNIVLSAAQGLAAVLQFESIPDARSAFLALNRMMLQLEVERTASANEQFLRVADVVTHTLQLQFVAPAAGGSGLPDVRGARRITAQLVRTQEDYTRMQIRN